MLCMLDTNICFYLIKRKPMTVVEKLKSYEAGDVAVSSISVAELEYGVCKSNRPDQNRNCFGGVPFCPGSCSI